MEDEIVQATYPAVASCVSPLADVIQRCPPDAFVGELRDCLLLEHSERARALQELTERLAVSGPHSAATLDYNIDRLRLVADAQRTALAAISEGDNASVTAEQRQLMRRLVSESAKLADWFAQHGRRIVARAYEELMTYRVALMRDDEFENGGPGESPPEPERVPELPCKRLQCNADGTTEWVDGTMQLRPGQSLMEMLGMPRREVDWWRTWSGNLRTALEQLKPDDVISICAPANGNTLRVYGQPPVFSV